MTTELQSTFEPFSKAPRANVVVPANLSAPMNEALKRIEEIHGDIDAFVSGQMRISVEHLFAGFAAHQVDSLAVMFDALQRDRTPVVASGPGTGKGRVAAGVMRRANVSGFIPVFITDKKHLFKDILRDLKDTGLIDGSFNPLILNGGQSLSVEIDGQVRTFSSARADEIAEFVKAGVLPAGYTHVFATYSQFAQKESAKTAWLRAIVGQLFFVCDESHKGASATSNTGTLIAEMRRLSGGMMGLSATFAKDGRALATYENLLPSSVDLSAVYKEINRGSTEIAELVCQLLAEDRVLVTYELDYAEMEIATLAPSEERIQRNAEIQDRIAGVLTAIATATGDVNRRINAFNANQIASIERLRTQDGALPKGARQIHVTAPALGSRMLLITKTLLAALKAEDAADLAIQSIREGRKPVIAIAGTLEALVRDLMGDDGVLSSEPSLKAFFHRELDYLSCTTKRHTIDGVKTTERINLLETNPAYAAVIAEIRTIVDTLPDMPILAYDIIHRRIAEAGFSSEEITGRSLTVQEDLSVTRRNRPIVEEVSDRFNSGELDSLLLNRAGATGLSLHASASFRDQRPRDLIILELQPSVEDQLQILGRIFRLGQVTTPRILQLSTGLPAEHRLMQLYQMAMSKLFANTRASIESQSINREIPDMMNRVGDDVALALLNERADLVERLAINLPDESTNETAVNIGGEYGRFKYGICSVLLSRLILLPVDEQVTVFQTLVSRFKSTLADHEANGTNPLVRNFVNGVYHTEGSVVLDVDAEQASAFNGPVVLTHLRGYEESQTPSIDDVLAAVDANRGRIDMVQEAQAYLRYRIGQPRLRAFVQANKPADVPLRRWVFDAETKNTFERAFEYQDIAYSFSVAERMAALDVGKSVTMESIWGDEQTGVITRISKERDMALEQFGFCPDPRDYMVEITTPDSDKPVRKTAFSLMMVRDRIGAGFDDPEIANALEESFGEGGVIRRRREFYALRGNMISALSLNGTLKLGKFGSWRTRDGLIESGITIVKQGKCAQAERLRPQIRTVTSAVELAGLARGAIVVSTISSAALENDGQGMDFVFVRDRILVVAPPKRARNMMKLFESMDLDNRALRKTTYQHRLAYVISTEVADELFSKVQEDLGKRLYVANRGRDINRLVDNLIGRRNLADQDRHRARDDDHDDDQGAAQTPIRPVRRVLQETRNTAQIDLFADMMAMGGSRTDQAAEAA